MFTITGDNFKRYLQIQFDSEFWDAAVVERFRSEIGVALQSLRSADGPYVVMVDLRNAILQSQDTVEAAKQFITASAAYKIALVASTALARMQTKRLQVRDNVILFEDFEKAETWLLQETSDVSTAVGGTCIA